MQDRSPFTQAELKALGFPGLNRLRTIRVSYALALLGFLLMAPAYFDLADDDAVMSLAGMTMLLGAFGLAFIRIPIYWLFELKDDASLPDAVCFAMLYGGIFLALAGLGMLYGAGRLVLSVLQSLQ